MTVSQQLVAAMSGSGLTGIVRCPSSLHSAAMRVWRQAWEPLIPFLEFPPDIRKILCTTNSSESFNYQLRKII